MINDETELIVEVGEYEPCHYGFVKDSNIADVQRQYPNKKFEIITVGEWEKRAREFYIGDNNKYEEISKQWYEDALNSLPPLKYTVIDDVTEFCSSEMKSGFYTLQYAVYKGRYYVKTVDITDINTWLHVNLKG